MASMSCTSKNVQNSVTWTGIFVGTSPLPRHTKENPRQSPIFDREILISLLVENSRASQNGLHLSDLPSLANLEFLIICQILSNPWEKKSTAPVYGRREIGNSPSTWDHGFISSRCRFQSIPSCQIQTIFYKYWSISPKTNQHLVKITTRNHQNMLSAINNKYTVTCRNEFNQCNLETFISKHRLQKIPEKPSVPFFFATVAGFRGNVDGN